MIRIGAHRDGSKTGVLLYCQEHAREWATSLVCLETAERLLRNYVSDPETNDLLDNLDVFIIPVINADGAAYSRYDFTSQRRNMVNHCASNPTGNNDPLARNTWGVDINRNFSVGSAFDGYVGASATNCTSDTFAGPSEFSEPESRNEQWVQSTFSNIKFANNVHSYGGYFMWPPGAYKTVGRETLPYATAGVNQFFDRTAAATLERIQSYRQTTVLPARTGPVADVLYSAAGNSADEAYYTHDIIGYDFEIGVDRFTGAVRTDGTPVVQQQGFTPPYNSEGHDEGQEFASGNVGLLTARARLRARPYGAGGDAQARREPGRRTGPDVRSGRAGRHLLHARRLDADQGVAGVRAGGPAPARPGRPPRRPGAAEVDRLRHQGPDDGRPDLRLELACNSG